MLAFECRASNGAQRLEESYRRYWTRSDTLLCVTVVDLRDRKIELCRQVVLLCGSLKQVLCIGSISAATSSSIILLPQEDRLSVERFGLIRLFREQSVEKQLDFSEVIAALRRICLCLVDQCRRQITANAAFEPGRVLSHAGKPWIALRKPLEPRTVRADLDYNLQDEPGILGRRTLQLWR